MRSAFAKLLQKDPVQNSTIDFRAGGNMVPILTRASGSSTEGYQTMGLPTGSKPMPGGGTNRTVLGAARMGDQDGNANASAGFNMTDIFTTPGQPEREYPERTFANVGNNVFQPENNDSALLSLLRRLGDQKFKAESQAPFEDYRAQQRLARDLDEASRNAGLNDLGTSREIIRNLAAQRRQQNEDDYLRKMLDAGATPEAAKKEIEDVRNANALQEAKKVDDRQYQAKTLIQRIAMSRGITPMVQEPLNQSSSIDNPQRSQAMSQAMGMPGEGFGTSPLDMNRQFLTPDFYKKFLRKSNISQESSDELTAFSNLISGGGNEDQLKNLQSGYSLATMKGQERQQQIELAAEGLASKLESIRSRGEKIKLPLPKAVVGKDIINAVYKLRSKEEGQKVLYSTESIQNMINPLQVLLAINFSVQTNTNGYENLLREVKKYSYGTEKEPSKNWFADFKKIAYALNGNEFSVKVPFGSVILPNLGNGRYVDLLNNIKTGAVPNLDLEIQQGRRQLQEVDLSSFIANEGSPIQLVERRNRNRGGRGSRRNRGGGADLAQVDTPGAPGAGGGAGVPVGGAGGAGGVILGRR